MSESSTSPPPEGDPPEGFDLMQFVIDTIRSIEFGDANAGILEERVARLEEVIVAPWYHRRGLLRTLRREIRASAATWPADYIDPTDFLGRRHEWASFAASARYDRQAWKPRFDQSAQSAPEAAADGAEDAPRDPGEGFLP